MTRPPGTPLSVAESAEGGLWERSVPESGAVVVLRVRPEKGKPVHGWHGSEVCRSLVRLPAVFGREPAGMCAVIARPVASGGEAEADTQRRAA